jgi:hypothetical protein
LGVSVSLITRIRELAWILIGLLLIKIHPAKGRTYKEIVEESEHMEEDLELDFPEEDNDNIEYKEKFEKAGI